MDVPLMSAVYKGKQVRVDKLNVLQRVAFDLTFPGFHPTTEPTTSQRRGLKQAAERGIPATWQQRPSRRFAGDDSLPTRRYYTLIRRASGDDGKALVMELAAYYDPQRAGPVVFLDLGHEDDALLVLGGQVPAAHGLVLGFIEPVDRSAPILQAVQEAGLQEEYEWLHSQMNLPDGWVGMIPIPYEVVDLDLSRVVDLRYPDCQDWFAAEFGTSDFAQFVAGDPDYRNVQDFYHLLPALLSPVPGGGMFDSISQYVGHWMRTHEVEALVYPSARTNAALMIRDGQIEDHRGWNLVDYRESPPPLIDLMLNMSLGPPPALPPGVSIVLPPPDEPSLRGSFTVRGLQEWHVERLNRPGASGILDLER